MHTFVILFLFIVIQFLFYEPGWTARWKAAALTAPPCCPVIIICLFLIFIIITIGVQRKCTLLWFCFFIFIFFYFFSSVDFFATNLVLHTLPSKAVIIFNCEAHSCDGGFDFWCIFYT